MNPTSFLKAKNASENTTQNEWLKKIDEASRKTPDEEEKRERFVSGLAREHKWIRVKPSRDLPLTKLKALVAESGLLSKSQNDNYLLIYGTDAQVKDFVKKITKKQGQKPGR